MENSHKQYSTVLCDTQANFRIDPEFENKIPPIGEAEFQQLRENILAAGEVYEPLVVWDGLLVDGHNRWKVIREHPEVKWRIRNMDFADKWAAFDWMYKNQLGRRNLTDEQRTYMIGKMYEARKQSVGGQIRGSAQNGHAIRTSEQIAKEIGVGKETVKRSEKFSKGVDALREVSPEAADKVLNGKSDATKSDVSELGKAEPELVKAFARAIEENKKPVRPKRLPKTDEEKRDLAEIEAIVRDMRDPTTTPKFTLDFLIEDIELNGQTYVELLDNTLKDREQLVTDENKPRIAAAITKVAENILKVRDSM